MGKQSTKQPWKVLLEHADEAFDKMVEDMRNVGEYIAAEQGAQREYERSEKGEREQ